MTTKWPSDESKPVGAWAARFRMAFTIPTVVRGRVENQNLSLFALINSHETI